MHELAAYTRLYRALAEALAVPDDWICRAGRQWSLFDAAVQAAHIDDDPVISQAVIDLAEIQSESLARRRARYDAIFSCAGRSRLFLHESLAREGRLVGACSYDLWAVYEAAGLIVAGTELPDHASVELSFLAYLVDQEATSVNESPQWRKARRRFVQRHIGQWLPAMGDTLAQTGDEVYGPVGSLLSASIRREIQPRRRRNASGGPRRLPSLPRPDLCNLCGFCIQVCPTRALSIQETGADTVLLLHPASCVSCGQCLRICSTQSLRLEPAPGDGNRRALRRSPRALCPGCGQPTVSRAELDAIAAQIGTPPWLDYCPDCRSLFSEKRI